MSLPDTVIPQHLGPARLKPVEGAPMLDASGEAERWVTDPFASIPPELVRARILAWLGEGAREVVWALCSLPRDRWAVTPPQAVDAWPALRHVRHLAVWQSQHLLPTVRRVLGEETIRARTTLELERADAAWNPSAAFEHAEATLHDFDATRFELLQRLEAAPDEVWLRPGTAPAALDWVLLDARQHELQHLSALWRIALNWDRVSLDAATIHGVPLHPADRLEESH